MNIASVNTVSKSILSDDPIVLAKIMSLSQSVFVQMCLDKLDAEGTRRPTPGASANVRIEGIRRDIRVWQSKAGKYGADKPSVFVGKADLDALIAGAQAKVNAAAEEAAKAAASARADEAAPVDTAVVA